MRGKGNPYSPKTVGDYKTAAEMPQEGAEGGREKSCTLQRRIIMLRKHGDERR